jgi:hypothetical protein
VESWAFAAYTSVLWDVRRLGTANISAEALKHNTLDMNITELYSLAQFFGDDYCMDAVTRMVLCPDSVQKAFEKDFVGTEIAFTNLLLHVSSLLLASTQLFLDVAKTFISCTGGLSFLCKYPLAFDM